MFGGTIQQVVLQVFPGDHTPGSGPDPSPIPPNALLAEDGTPILNENGDYILVESDADTDDGLWHDAAYFTSDDGLWHDAIYFPEDDGLWHDAAYF